MTACKEFYDKLKKDPDFCGLTKKEVETRLKYAEFVKRISEDHGFKEQDVFKNATYNAICPILGFSKNSDLRKQTTEKIVRVLKERKKVTAPVVRHMMGREPEPKPTKPVVVTREHATTRFTVTLSDKIKTLTSILSTGQKGILLEIMEQKNCDNEYAALCYLFTLWASGEVVASRIV